MSQHTTKNNRAKILWLQTDKQLQPNQWNKVVVDKKQKIDMGIPADNNIRKKGHEKIEKYQGLKEQLF